MEEKKNFKMIKAIFFDIDGTSYSHKIYDIPPSAKYAFKKLKEAGIHIGICTSRSLEEMRELPEGFVDSMDAVVCLAGTQIYMKGQCVNSHFLAEDEIHAVLHLLDEHDITYRWVSADNVNCLNRHDEEIENRFYMLYRMIPDIKPYEGEQLVHLLYYTHDEALLKQVEAICQTNYHMRIHYSNEIMPPNINKGHGIIECAQLWGIKPDEIAAFGDGMNDLEMVEAAQIGIAMGNACDELKQAADYVTDHIDQDGIYRACVHFGWIKE